MDDVSINLIEKTVAENECWATVLNYTPAGDENTINIIKVSFDRTYPYIWLTTPRSGFIGVATSIKAIKNALEPSSHGLSVNLYADGIFCLDFKSPFCIALGPRKSFYLFCPDVSITDSEPSAVDIGVRISAQDVPVNPFGNSPW